MSKYITRNLRKPVENITIDEEETSKRSILLTVPVYFYIEFIKMYITPILFYLAGLLGILLVYIYGKLNQHQKKVQLIEIPRLQYHQPSPNTQKNYLMIMHYQNVMHTILNQLTFKLTIH